MKAIFRYLSFFPSITFSLISLSTFPWVLFYQLALFKLYKSQLVVVIAFLVTSAFSVLIHGADDIFELIRALIAFVVGPLAFIMVSRIPTEEFFRFVRATKSIFWFLICFGLVQYSGILLPLESVWQVLVPTGSLDPLRFGRGVTLMSSEPSIAGWELLFIYLVFRKVFLEGHFKFFTDLFLMAFYGIVLKSFMVFGIYVFYLTIAYRGYAFFWVFLVAVVVSIFYSSNIDLSNRLFSILEMMVSAGLVESFWILLNESGHRLPSVISVYCSMVDFPLGGGIGNWAQSSVNAANSCFNDIEFKYFVERNDGQFFGVRPYSYLANLFLDFGILAMILLGALLIGIKQRILFSVEWLFFVFSLLFFSTVGNPVSWIALGLCNRFDLLERSKIKTFENEPYNRVVVGRLL